MKMNISLKNMHSCPDVLNKTHNYIWQPCRHHQPVMVNGCLSLSLLPVSFPAVTKCFLTGGCLIIGVVSLITRGGGLPYNKKLIEENIVVTWRFIYETEVNRITPWFGFSVFFPHSSDLCSTKCWKLFSCISLKASLSRLNAKVQRLETTQVDISSACLDHSNRLFLH